MHNTLSLNSYRSGTLLPGLHDLMNEDLKSEMVICD